MRLTTVPIFSLNRIASQVKFAAIAHSNSPSRSGRFGPATLNLVAFGTLNLKPGVDYHQRGSIAVTPVRASLDSIRVRNGHRSSLPQRS